jgi:hypothetical protein
MFYAIKNKRGCKIEKTVSIADQVLSKRSVHIRTELSVDVFMWKTPSKPFMEKPSEKNTHINGRQYTP